MSILAQVSCLPHCNLSLRPVAPAALCDPQLIACLQSHRTRRGCCWPTPVIHLASSQAYFRSIHIVNLVYELKKKWITKVWIPKSCSQRPIKTVLQGSISFYGEDLIWTHVPLQTVLTYSSAVLLFTPTFYPSESFFFPLVFSYHDLLFNPIHLQKACPLSICELRTQRVTMKTSSTRSLCDPGAASHRTN